MSPAILSALLTLLGEAFKMMPEFVRDVKDAIAAFEGQQSAPHTPIAPEVKSEMEADLKVLETPVVKK
jgi:hypothetical protein